MWTNNGRNWYSEEEINRLKEELENLSFKYSLAEKQNIAIQRHYTEVLNENKRLKELIEVKNGK